MSIPLRLQNEKNYFQHGNHIIFMVSGIFMFSFDWLKIFSLKIFFGTYERLFRRDIRILWWSTSLSESRLIAGPIGRNTSQHPVSKNQNRHE